MACAIGLTRVIKPFKSAHLVSATLLLMMLACTSNDTLFIQLTATPPPTLTATPLAAVTRFKIGDKPVFVAAASPQALYASPNANDKSGSSNLCFSSTQVAITDLAIGVDNTVYYKIKCASANGWTLETNLTLLKAGSSAALKMDTYLTNDPGSDDPTNRAADQPCKAGTKVGVLDLAMMPKEKVIYVQIQCGAMVGWLNDTALDAVVLP